LKRKASVEVYLEIALGYGIILIMFISALFVLLMHLESAVV
jgi:hypothetical protein